MPSSGTLRRVALVRTTRATRRNIPEGDILKFNYIIAVVETVGRAKLQLRCDRTPDYFYLAGRHYKPDYHIPYSHVCVNLESNEFM
jgi:hypothetical protein